MTERAAYGSDCQAAADKVRRAYPLSYVHVKPCYTAVGCVLLRRGARGAWEIRTVDEAIDLKREWKREARRKRKGADNVKVAVVADRG